MTDITPDLDRGCPTTPEPAVDDETVVDPAPFARLRDDGEADLELLVRGAHCAGCMSKIEGGVAKLAGVSAARLNLSSGKLTVRFDPRAVEPIAISETVVNLGYHAAPFDPAEALKDEDLEGRRLLRAMAVAGFAAANVMLLSVSVWAGNDGGEMNASTRAMFHWISALIAGPAALYAGRPFFESAWRALRRGGANMDVPISLAVLLALGLSVVETFNQNGETYFDAAVMLLFFLLIGRWLDHTLRRKARAAARDLLALQAQTASRIEADGHVVAVAARDVQPGDRLVLAAGDRAPVDAVVEEGFSDADVSLVTGESAPVTMGPGDEMLAGVINLTQRLVVVAKARARDSFLADLARLIEAGEQAKTRYVRLADRAARLYVPFVHSAALLTFVGWMIAGAGLHTAVINAISLLIITCPCALGLAVPAVQVVATGRLFRAGVLVKSGDALERLADADHAVFDKTGTLTTGKLALVNADALPAGVLETAAKLARASRHPIARAIAMAAGKGPLADDVTEEPGAGVSGVIDGRCVRLGSAAWVGAAVAGDADADAWLAVEGEEPQRLALRDVLRPDVVETLAALEARGVSVEMLTGDRPGPARAVASALGIETWRAEASPRDKTDRLDVLKAEGRKVLMVGDGLNDAPALARAHVSISPGTAAEASQHAADYVLQGESFAPVVEAIDVARAAKRRVLENFAFAAAYNAIAAPLAISGHVTPLIAAIAMSSSSLIVTLNALRLARRKARS